jgi:putative DNA primase/helicase
MDNHQSGAAEYDYPIAPVQEVVADPEIFTPEFIDEPAIETPAEPTKPNFETSLDAAVQYAHDDHPVIPICNYDPETGGCTAPRHDSKGKDKCSGKKPLVKNRNGEGYAASTDLKQIRRWFENDFPNAGVGIRLDRLILIDCDIKGGAPGLESFRVLKDTFDLPETLTAITHSGGRHYVYKLPEGLPPDFLKSWTRVLDSLSLGGIDIKVGTKGLLFAEPTRGKQGVYRWLNYGQEPAVLSMEVCQAIHEARFAKDREKEAARAVRENGRSAPPLERRVIGAAEGLGSIPDQSKGFRDASAGDRHSRLLTVGAACRRTWAASESQIAEVMRWHAARFSDPLDDEAWIIRTARSIAQKYLPTMVETVPRPSPRTTESAYNFQSEERTEWIL